MTRSLTLTSITALFLTLVPAQTALAGAQEIQPSQVPAMAQGPAGGVSKAPASVTSVAPLGAILPQAAPVPSEVPEFEIPPVPDSLRLSPPRPITRLNEISDIPSGQGSLRGLKPLLAAPAIAFPAFSYTTRIPPDPVIAAGPNQLVAAVNSQWAIYSKSGALLSINSAATWFQNVLTPLNNPNLSIPYDPQVIYDHYAGRWVLIYVTNDPTSQSWILISASSSSDPTGHWCSWAIEGNKEGGTTVSNWSDFPQLGFDSQAVYLGLNQYTFATQPQYVYAKVRILPKSALYSCGPLSWSDFWNLRDPVNPAVAAASSVRPAIALDASPSGYVASASPFQTLDYVTLWTITNPASGSPSISGVNVPVQAAARPPNADQPGGSSPGTSTCPSPCLIDTGDGRLVSATYRGNSLWLTQSIAGGTGNAYSRVRYVKLDVPSRTVTQDQALGVDGCWYFYPAISVDSVGNMVMVFGRSCTNDYAGVRYSGRSATDSSIQASTSMRVGEAPYVNPDSKGKNRWGDYFRAATDPTDPAKIWTIGEYAALPGNAWATYIAETAVTCSAPTIPVTGNNGPLVAGQTLQLTASSSPGASYSWSGPNGFSSSLQNPVIPNITAAAAGTYNVSASFGDCTSLGGSTTVAVAAAPTCTPNATTLCLNNGRFRVTASWQTTTASGVGNAVPITTDTGYFWFFSSGNIEVVIKVLNACSFTGGPRYWVFAAGLTNVYVTITVTDTRTGAVNIYQNPLNTAFQPIQDTNAFATCP
jgi:hypothetical protein